MNERIRELADQCYHRYSEYNIDLEKFAELIVRECMDCSIWVGTMNKNPVEPMHTAVAINKRIKKQFGVEE